MGEHFNRITEVSEFDGLVEQSKSKPVIIFKHSTTCPMSAAAYREMAHFDDEVALVEVQRARELSREIENRTGIRHESPQVIIMRNGQVIWDASHFEIRHEAVTEVVNKAGQMNGL